MKKVIIILAITMVTLAGCSSTNNTSNANNTKNDVASSNTTSKQSTKNVKTFDVNLQQGVKFNYTDGNYNSRTGTIDMHINKIVFDGACINFEMSINNNSPAQVRVSTDGFTNLQLKSNGSTVENKPTEINGGKNFDKFSNETFTLSFYIADSNSYSVDKPMSIELNVNTNVKDFGGSVIKFNTDLNK